MEKKRKKINLKYVVIILSLIVFLSMSVFTFAYFTDSKSYSGDLTFGSLELDVSGGVSGDGEDTVASKLVFDVARKTASDPTWTGKIMPGDTIDINLTLGLKTGSEPAYYLISITDDYGVFENAVYFSEDGTNVYVLDGTKTYKQGDTAKTAVTDKYCGKLTTEKSQNIKIGAKISENFSTQNAVANITCKIEAIQQANLPPVDARTKLLVGETGDTNKKLYSQVEYLQGTGTQWIDTGYYVDNNTSVEADFQFTDLTVQQRVFGHSYDENFDYSNKVSYCFYINGGGGYSYAFKNETGNWAYLNVTAKTDRASVKFDAVKRNVVLTFNGEEYTQNITNSINKSPVSLTLFYDHAGRVEERPIAKMKMYSFKIWDGSEIKQKLIPTIRNSDNKPGLFDTVSGTFFTNSGTGEFLWG